MSRNSWAQRTGAGGRPLFSASQIGKRKCHRRWGFRYLDKLDDPAGPAAVKGSAAHEEVELFEKLGKIPSTPWARRALKYAPAPGIAEVEAPVRFDRWACWLGYIDLVYGWEFYSNSEADTWCGAPGDACDVGSPVADAVVIHDWKFTGSLRNAKSAEELSEDAAACIYAYEAYLGGAQRVIGRWVYIEMNDKADVKEVWFELRRETVERVVAELDNEAMVAERDVLEHRKGRLKVLDLKVDEDQCWAYRQQCPFFGPCHESPGTTPRARFSLAKAKGDDTMSSFKDSMDARFPDGGKAPPPSSKGAPPPSSKAPPPSSKPAGAPPPSSKKPILSDEDVAAMKEQAAESVGKVEKGLVNPPEAGDEAPRNPEEAAAMQGAKKPEPPPPDDLDNLPGDEKAQRALVLELALKIGAAEEGTKMRLVGLRNAVRVKRKQDNAVTAKIINGKVVDGFCEDTTDQALQSAINAEEHGAPGAEEARKEIEERIEQKSCDDSETREEEDEVGSAFPCLFVNCDFIGEVARDVDIRSHIDIVKAAEEKLGVNDFRFIDYGKGPAELCCAIRAMAEEGYFNSVELVTVDARTPGGSAVVDVLRELAGCTVRGF